MPLQLNLQPKKTKNVDTKSIFTWFSLKGRYILLLLNIALFGIYIYRFYLDRENSILTDRIESLTTAVVSYETKAIKYDGLQKQATFITERRAQNVDEYFVLQLVKETIPQKVKILKLEVNGKELVITASSNESGDFSNFISFLVDNPRIKNLILVSSNFRERTSTYETKLKLSYL